MEAVPLGRWALGKVFHCARCDAALVMPRWTAAIWGGVATVTFGLLSDHVPQDGGSQVALFAVLVAVILPLSWMTRTVRLACVG
tara:strand:- start:2079 stop:2330 length:252 start_codon:yes stop_codon:yes gene_type:complete